MDHTSLHTLFLLLSATTAAVVLARRLQWPSMLAYLGVGAALGPHGFAWLKESAEVNTMAELGVVFLMFTIGLEFSLKRLMAMRRLVFGLGAGQMALTACATALVTWWGYGQGAKSGVAIGLAVAMSSTAIVARLLSDAFELHSRSGRQTMGVLLFQDLAVVPCLILFPALAAPGEALWRSLGWAALQATVVLTLLVFLGQRYLGRVVGSLARHRSEELLLLSTLWIVVGLSYLTAATGLSMALGAFVGGMLISETLYRHQVEADIRPFRDILLGLFFVTMGMMLDLGFVLNHLHKLALALVLLVAGKGLVVLTLALLTRTPLAVALRTAAQLAQGGEFGLVLVQLAHSLGLIGTDVFQITLAAMLLSMFVAPMLIRHASRFSADLGRSGWMHGATVIQDIAVHSMDLREHVIVCGYGRTGGYIAQFLTAQNIPFLALDTDPQCIAQAQKSGMPVVFGNADRPEVLQAAGLARARAVVVSYPDPRSAERVVHLARQARTTMPVLVRTHDAKDAQHLLHAGATEVIAEVQESALLLAMETLTHLGVPAARAMELMQQARKRKGTSNRA